MQAGKLRHRVTLQEKSVSRNAYHDEVVSWSDVATVWAEIQPLEGREFFESQRLGAEQPSWIRIRHRSDVTPSMRVVRGSVTYDIETVVDVDGLGKELRLMCNQVIDS